MRAAIILSVLMLTLFGGIVFARLTSDAPIPNNETAMLPKEGPISIEGKVVCLPPKDTRAPSTTVCIYGLQDDTGRYYMLRSHDDDSQDIVDLPMNKTITVEGIYSRGGSLAHPTIGDITLNNNEEQENG